MNDQPKFDGSVRMSQAEAKAEIRRRTVSAYIAGKLTVQEGAARLSVGESHFLTIIRNAKRGVEVPPRHRDGAARARILEAAATAKTMPEVAEKTGCHITYVYGVLSRDAPDLYSRLSVKERQRAVASGSANARRRIIIEQAPHVSSIAELVDICQSNAHFVETVLLERAPDQHKRLVSEARQTRPAFCWHSRAHDLFPHDPALARSLARAASFVSVTKGGRTVRLVPPLHEAHPRALPGAAA